MFINNFFRGKTLHNNKLSKEINKQTYSYKGNWLINFQAYLILWPRL